MLKTHWIKVLRKVNSENKAKELIEQLKRERGEGVYSIIKPSGNEKKYQVGVFDESQLGYFDDMDAKNTQRATCTSCGRVTSYNRFFRCINCENLECYDCGFKRLFNNQVPLMHQCDRDNFEFLASIGTCTRCGEAMGFKSIPQALRMRMLARLLLEQSKMASFGLLGCFIAEQGMVENEILKTFGNLKILATHLKQQNLSREQWFALYRSCKAHVNRLEWSASYIVNVVGRMTKRLNMDYTGTVDKINIIYPVLQFAANLHSVILNMIDGKMNERDYITVIAKFNDAMNSQASSSLSNTLKRAIGRLFSLGRNIRDPAYFQLAASIIQDLVLLEEIDSYFSSYVGTLCC